uniref:CBS domain-containing protein n=1 Tax=Globodera rostochiensis TaxID=31243 RepID=A0A914HYG0_GLORO
MRRLLELRKCSLELLGVGRKNKVADLEKEMDGGAYQKHPEKGKGPKRLKCTRRWANNFRSVAEDWLFLAMLGVVMAICSLAMDAAIDFLQKLHLTIIDSVEFGTRGDRSVSLIYTYAVWVSFPMLLVLLSALFVRTVAPQAIGSGIPEMKTILRGVILKEYLTLRTLISKMVGLTFSLGSGMPIGKEGPFVHIASVVANLLSQCVHSNRSPFGNESHSYEMLSAACAVGVSSTFSAPVGGVLFSIEVTSAYFAIRNYWRGFFAATCSATLLRIIRVLTVETEVTVTAFYQTQFPRDAFFPEELPFFALIGIFCGFLSAAFIFVQRQMVLFLRHNKLAKLTFQRHWVIYPALVAFTVGSLTYPSGFGRFLGAEKRFSQTAKDFFASCTWSVPSNSSMGCAHSMLSVWTGPEGKIDPLFSLLCFVFSYFFLNAMASTVPIPSGIFGPSFVLGAAFGRLVGELVAELHPEGIKGPRFSPVYPGVYAVVGAAAFCGGVTHTVSVAVIVFELTGQLLHILPVMIAVLSANAISSYLQPSIYDSAIRIKRLPYLPDIPHNSSRFHFIRVGQFMTREVHCFSNATTFAQLREMLSKYPNLKAFPIVENGRSRILIGSCSRSRMLRALHSRIGTQERLWEAQKRGAANCGKMPLGRKRRESTANEMTERREFADENGWEGNAEAEDFVVRRFSVVPPLANSDGSLGCPFLDASDTPTKRTATVKRSKTIPASINTSERSGNHLDVYGTFGGMINTLSRLSARIRSNGFGNEREEDDELYGEKREEWERKQLAAKVNFDLIGIDPAPFQLVENTSLIKVHSLFSLLSLNRAYVTRCGRLIGVVALRDLRIAIERVDSGNLSAEDAERHFEEEQPPIGGDEEGHQQQGKPQHQQESSSEASDYDDDSRDILNPRLEVISQSTCTDGVASLRESVRVGTRVRKASEVLREAVKSLAKGVLGESPEAQKDVENGRVAEAADAVGGEERHNTAIDGRHNNGQLLRVPPPAIFIISSDEGAEDEERAKERPSPGGKDG